MIQLMQISMNVSLEEDVTTSVPTSQDLISALVDLDPNWIQMGICVWVGKFEYLAC